MRTIAIGSHTYRVHLIDDIGHKVHRHDAHSENTVNRTSREEIDKETMVT